MDSFLTESPLHLAISQVHLGQIKQGKFDEFISHDEGLFERKM